MSYIARHRLSREKKSEHSSSKIALLWHFLSVLTGELENNPCSIVFFLFRSSDLVLTYLGFLSLLWWVQFSLSLCYWSFTLQVSNIEGIWERKSWVLWYNLGQKCKSHTYSNRVIFERRLTQRAEVWVVFTKGSLGTEPGCGSLNLARALSVP